MRSSGKRARVAVATTAIWLSVCTAAAAQTARERYESAVERDAKVRAQLTSTTGRTAAPDLAAELRQAITAFEIIVRRFPTSGYADNALFQAASLADAAYEKFNRADDRERALKFYRWLVQEYPASTFVSRANAKLELLAAPVVIERATLTDIQRTVMARSVRVTLALDREVQYLEQRLSGPARVYFDLRNVQLTPTLIDTVLTYPSDVVNKIRTGRHPDHVVRVVLDLEDVSKYSVFTLYNPFRLVIDAERTASRAATTPGPPLPSSPLGTVTALLNSPKTPAASGADLSTVGLPKVEASAKAAAPVIAVAEPPPPPAPAPAPSPVSVAPPPPTLPATPMPVTPAANAAGVDPQQVGRPGRIAEHVLALRRAEAHAREGVGRDRREPGPPGGVLEPRRPAQEAGQHGPRACRLILRLPARAERQEGRRHLGPVDVARAAGIARVRVAHDTNRTGEADVDGLVRALGLAVRGSRARDALRRPAPLPDRRARDRVDLAGDVDGRAVGLGHRIPDQRLPVVRALEDVRHRRLAEDRTAAEIGDELRVRLRIRQRRLGAEPRRLGAAAEEPLAFVGDDRRSARLRRACASARGSRRPC